ncbi:hypothetical protein COOONC_15375 [Cooperia oncophora]
MMGFIRHLQARLTDYRWRFAPAVYARLARSDRSAIPLTVDIPKEEVDLYLRNVLELLAREFYDINFAKGVPQHKREHAWDVLEKYLGFLLVRRPSTISGAGNGVFVEKDGNDVRLSRRIHRSCCYRDLAPDVSDLTWLEDEPFNYLNMGQYINNEPGPNLHNVQYFDLDIYNWPQRLRKFLPFVAYSPHRTAPLRVVVLISVREIVEGEELFSAYISK